MDDLSLGRSELAGVIGRRLRDVRRARGLSQQALAENLFSKGYVSSIEHGKIFPSVRALQSLAARLGVDMSEFFDPALLAAQAPAPVDTAGADEVRRNSLALLEVRALAAGGSPTALQRLRTVDPELLTPPERVQLHHAIAQAQLAAHRPDLALDELQQALAGRDDDDEAEGDSAVTQQVHSLLGEVLLARGQAALAADHLQRAYQIVQEQPIRDPLLRLTILSTQARALAAVGDTARARATYQEAAQLSQEIGTLDRLARSLTLLSRQAAEARDWTRAEQYGTQAILLNEFALVLRRGLRAQLELAGLLAALGDANAARERLDAGLALAAQLGDDAARAEAHAQLAELDLLAGDLAAAGADVAQAQAAAERSRDRRALALARYASGLTAHAQGDPTAADAAFHDALTALPDLGDHELLSRVLFAYGRILAERGRLADAAGYYERAYLTRTRGQESGVRSQG